MIKTKKEAYLFFIYWLQQNKTHISSEGVSTSCEMLKTAFENHEQDYQVVFERMSTLIPQINNDQLRVELRNIIQSLSQIDYAASTQQERFENPISRKFESCIAVELFLNPTQEMMKSVSAISLELIKLLQELQGNLSYQNKVEKFLEVLDSAAHVIACGAFDGKPKIEEVIAILERNAPQDFARIIHIHYKFAAFAMREVPLSTVVYREPVGGFLDRINEEFSGGYETFFQGLSISDSRGYSARALISDTICYLSPLYTAERNRGRKDAIRYEETNQLGIMLPSQSSAEFPVYKDQEWVADARSQEPDFDSQYVHDLIDNDGVYVAGPSGMTSLLLGLMENIGNFDSIEMKQHYLLAIVAYIVGGGFHSIHEVIGPAQYALYLVPGYPIKPPVRGQLAAPPHYKVFFDQQEGIDPEFYQYRENAWEFLLVKFNDQLRESYSSIIEKSVSVAAEPSTSSPNFPVPVVELGEPEQLLNAEKSGEATSNDKRVLFLLPVDTAIKKYLRWSNQQTFSLFSLHGSAGRRKVEYLNQCCQCCNTVEEIVELLRDFFCEAGRFNLSDYPAKARCRNYSFISFLLNELKQNQDALDLLNQFSTVKLSLTKSDYTLADASASRREAFCYMKGLEIRAILAHNIPESSR